MKFSSSLFALSLALCAGQLCHASRLISVNVIDNSDPSNLLIGLDQQGVYPTQRGLLLTPEGSAISDGVTTGRYYTQTEFLHDVAPQFGFDLNTVLSGSDSLRGAYSFSKLSILGGFYDDNDGVNSLSTLQAFPYPSFQQPTSGDADYYAYEGALNWAPYGLPHAFIVLGDGTPAGSQILMVNQTPEPASWVLAAMGIGLFWVARKRVVR